MHWMLILMLLLGAAQAHEALDLEDPSVGSAATVGIWLFTVLGGVGFLGSLGLMLGNLGRQKNLVMTGAIGAVLSAGVAGAAGYALYSQQAIPADRTTLHLTDQGWTVGYGGTASVKNVLILPVGEIREILAESELPDTRLTIPMLGLDVELPRQQVVTLSFSVPMEGDFLAMDGKLTVRGVKKTEFESFLKEQKP
ncbi:hypothetical protein [Deinococcus cellulosilyticus]|uniref:Uncharacterized protein n=1 Tax=Deinococcus cellulosilyticus (strain DSM 18568 / NBRC 106333 / KACC 11606 / 5516J-15) TaxID=1223518 RepID=A0A511MX95_DEIC1|nr:hypothetical protein [Deinococcus cellulosilyticus]GEM45204.1 hypothetical protein DC3_08390 [Deinococcus cellulosilyticus NBRC 106333 = KACC 11606]